MLYCCICGNMFMNVLSLKNHLSHFVVVVETCWRMFKTWGLIWIAGSDEGKIVVWIIWISPLAISFVSQIRRWSRGGDLLLRKERVQEEMRLYCWFLWKHASSLHFSQRGFEDIDVSLDELDEDTMAEERDSERRKVGLLDLWKRVDEFQWLTMCKDTMTT